MVIAAGGYWGRVVTGGIRSQRALTTRIGNMFCLKCNEQPLENCELANDVIS